MYNKVIEGQVLQSIQSGNNIKIMKLLDEAYELTKKTILLFLAILLASFIVMILLGFVFMLIFGISFGVAGFEELLTRFTYFGTGAMIINIVLSLALGALFAPLNLGPFYIAHNVYTENDAMIFDYFNGYMHFKEIAIATILTSLPALIVGAVLPAVSGVVSVILGFLFMFTLVLIAFNKYGFQTAISASVQLVTKNIGLLILSFIVLLVINFLGALLIGLGLLFTIPFSYCYAYLVFNKLCLNNSEDGLEIEDNLIEI